VPEITVTRSGSRIGKERTAKSAPFTLAFATMAAIMVVAHTSPKLPKTNTHKNSQKFRIENPNMMINKGTMMTSMNNSRIRL